MSSECPWGNWRCRVAVTRRTAQAKVRPCCLFRPAFLLPRAGERLLITAKAPQVVRDLPAALRVQDPNHCVCVFTSNTAAFICKMQETLQFDQCNYNLREQISSLLVGADAQASLFQHPSARRCAAVQKQVGHFPNERKALEDFEACRGYNQV